MTPRYKLLTLLILLAQSRSFRITKAERLEWERAADKAREPQSAWIRKRLIELAKRKLKD